MKTQNDIVPTPRGSLDPAFVSQCESINAKRARTVIDHILLHGIITNEDLATTYGYDHPPRAIRDVRENGIPLITHKVISDKTGRKIGAYTFGNPEHILRGRIGGRKAFSKQFKQQLVDTYQSRDAFTGETLDERYLQIDHRIPYQIAGDGDGALETANYMLIDASSQRAKSWSCENCDNFLEHLDPDHCSNCFWAYPEHYTHIALVEKRRLDIVWSGRETIKYDGLFKKAQEHGLLLQDYVKMLLTK